MMTIFEKAAIKAVELLNNQNITPEDAWFNAISQFTNSYETQKKQCPKHAFVDLYYHNKLKLIHDIPNHSNYPSQNGKYALMAVELIKNQPQLASNKRQLWHETLSALNCYTGTAHNGQMDIVIALFNAGLLRME